MISTGTIETSSPPSALGRPVWWAVLLALTVCLAMAPVPADGPASPTPDYSQLLRELRPKMIFEFSEENLNAYLRAHPREFAIPEGFEDPRVAFGEGLVEVSARTKVLFVPTRVRVSMIPEVVRGRLHLRVHRVQAGPIPLPSNFHRGTADTIAGVVNSILDRNQVQLMAVEAERGLIRVTAAVEEAERIH